MQGPTPRHNFTGLAKLWGGRPIKLDPTHISWYYHSVEVLYEMAIQVENRFSDEGPLLGPRTLSLNFGSRHLILKPKSIPEMGYGVESWWMYFFGVWTTL